MGTLFSGSHILTIVVIFAGQSFNGRETSDGIFNTVLFTSLLFLTSWLLRKTLFSRNSMVDPPFTALKRLFLSRDSEWWGNAEKKLAAFHWKKSHWDPSLHSVISMSQLVIKSIQLIPQADDKPTCKNTNNSFGSQLSIKKEHNFLLEFFPF